MKIHENLFLEFISTLKLMGRTIWGNADPMITGPQFGVLRQLVIAGPLMPTEISQRLLVSPGNVTGIIRRLHRQGLVERRRLTSDRRRLRLSLTEKGREVHDAMEKIWKRGVTQCFSSLPHQEIETMTTLLRKVQETIRSRENMS